jgi:NAD(P)-dependent dehydrogenase (short-subunit alcohol dehydrogenase family)
VRRFADLSGKRFLITGASSGIGRSCAELFAGLGASLVLVSRDGARLEEVRSSLCASERHEIFPADLSEVSQIAPLVEKVVSSGPLDGIVHSAGVCTVVPIAAVSAAAVEKSMSLNLTAFLELMRCCTRKGAANQGFSAVAVSSVSASAGWAGGSVYSASKGALSAAVRSLAVELAPRGYRVNCVSPSNIRTALFERLTAFNGEEAMAELRSRQPLGFGLPGQVASAVAFLASGEAAFITGADLPVDGGYLAK